MLRNLIVVLSLVFAATGRGYTVNLGEWNVYYGALDDPFGRRAIISSIDAAAVVEPFDFFAIVEASGDTAKNVRLTCDSSMSG